MEGAHLPAEYLIKMSSFVEPENWFYSNPLRATDRPANISFPRMDSGIAGKFLLERTKAQISAKNQSFC
jgi:hypothetical protein